jgi:hypothetical protein
MENIINAPEKKDRIKDTKYLLNGEIRIWHGKLWHCNHNRRKSQCKECGGGSICKHDKRKTRCKECGGSQICKHNKEKSECKECGGSAICKHNRFKSSCKECGGSAICSHNRSKSQCKECGGSAICEHNRKKANCKECGGSQICSHNREKSSCKECCPDQYLTHIMRARVREALKHNSKSKKTMEYVGCDIKCVREHLEKQFTDGMNWKNQGEWHIDHIRPCASFNLKNDNEKDMCFHYTNLQPLWKTDNLCKSAKYDENGHSLIWIENKWIKKIILIKK